MRMSGGELFRRSKRREVTRVSEQLVLLVERQEEDWEREERREETKE